MRQNASKKKQNISKLLSFGIYNYGSNSSLTIPYHPETNAIEEFFSQLKHYIKKQSPQTYQEIHKTISNTIDNNIQSTHLENYLKHAFRIYN